MILRVCYSFLLLTSCFFVQAQDINDYSIRWNKPSSNAGESMPCGGGDIGMNVWVENGDILIYLSKSGFFDENNALMKAGRIRIKIYPAPFAEGVFKQELHLKDGFVSIEGKVNGKPVVINIWASVTKPIAHISIKSGFYLKIEAGYESWRYQDRVIKSRENFGNSYKWAAPKNNIYKKDSIDFRDNGIVFYHHNTAKTIFDTTVSQQGMDAVKDQLYNPLSKLAFGGRISSSNFKPFGTYTGTYANTDFKGWRMISKVASPTHLLHVSLFDDQVEDILSWTNKVNELDALANKNWANDFKESKQWWNQYWERSFVHIGENPGSEGWEIARNYQLFRYMLGANAKGKWPTKFNGGLFTVDPVYTDSNMKLTPDYRNWGGGLHTMQNQRLVYYPMIKSGDWDLLQPQLNFYLRILKNAELRSKVYWNHSGACFTEQMENYGLPDFAEYGQNRPDNFDKGVEFNAWLEYEWDTVLEFCLMMLDEYAYTGKSLDSKLEFIESCLVFFDEHYQYLAKQRGIKGLDGNGKLVLYPGSGGETYKMAYNSTSTIAALQTITKRLLQLPATIVDDERKKKWQSFLQRIPPLNYTNVYGQVTIAPALHWERINNVETMQLYPVFPWGIFGIGKPGLDTAINTWTYDSNAIKFRSHVGWKQDNIWAARLGLTNEAWKYTKLKLASSGRAFPTFWGPGFDWVPDHNWGGSGMIGLQEMLMQTDGEKIMLLPAWPKEIDVHFKLHAPANTTVEVIWKKGKLVKLEVMPESRKKDAFLM